MDRVAQLFEELSKELAGRKVSAAVLREQSDIVLCTRYVEINGILTPLNNEKGAVRGEIEDRIEAKKRTGLKVPGFSLGYEASDYFNMKKFSKEHPDLKEKYTEPTRKFFLKRLAG